MINLPIKRSSQNSNTDSNNLVQSPSRPSRRVLKIQAVLYCAWVLNLLLLVAAFVWVVSDGRSLHGIRSLENWLGIPASFSRTDAGGPGSVTAVVKAAGIGLALALGSLLAMIASLFAGVSRLRTTRWWLLFMAAVCAWLGLFTTWPEIYWLGQQLRVQKKLEAAANVVRIVSAKWPANDGEIAGVGTFLAYPKQSPTTLLMLGRGEAENRSLQFSAIERSADGAIRLELAGRESGAWLEWRPDDRPPRSFVSGLETNYTIGRYERLTPQWFLVRYDASGSNTPTY
jgi:hypothetical protein